MTVVINDFIFLTENYNYFLRLNIIIIVYITD